MKMMRFAFATTDHWGFTILDLKNLYWKSFGIGVDGIFVVVKFCGTIFEIGMRVWCVCVFGGRTWPSINMGFFHSVSAISFCSGAGVIYTNTGDFYWICAFESTAINDHRLLIVCVCVCERAIDWLRRLASWDTLIERNGHVIVTPLKRENKFKWKCL